MDVQHSTFELRWDDELPEETGEQDEIGLEGCDRFVDDLAVHLVVWVVSPRRDDGWNARSLRNLQSPSAGNRTHDNPDRGIKLAVGNHPQKVFEAASSAGEEQRKSQRASFTRGLVRVLS